MSNINDSDVSLARMTNKMQSTFFIKSHNDLQRTL